MPIRLTMVAFNVSKLICFISPDSDESRSGFCKDFARLREAYLQKIGADMERQREIMASAAYQEGDPETVAARYRIHFKPALMRPADYERLMATMKAGFIRQGKEGIVKARAVEYRLMAETWRLEGYDLLPRLRNLNIPTLVIYGDHDFIPGEIAVHIAEAIPKARLVTIRDCGHFPYLEKPDEVRSAFDGFFVNSPNSPQKAQKKTQKSH